MTVDLSKVENIYNYCVEVAAEPSPETEPSKTIYISVPFVHDCFSVEMAILNQKADTSNCFISPTQFNEEGKVVEVYAHSNCFEVRSNLVRNDLLTVCNQTNSWNPQFWHMNANRDQISGTFNVVCRNAVLNADLIGGLYILKFTFYRLK